MAFDLVAAYADNIAPFYQKDVSPAVVEINQAPQQVTLRFSAGVRIDPATLAGNVSVVSTVHGPIDIGLSVDDLPNQNQVVIRFKETLRDGSYQINIGAGLRSEAPVDSAAATTVNVRVELGAFVVGVVPQPVFRASSGALRQARGQIDVYFNTEDPLLASSVQNPSFYRLLRVDPATNAELGPAALPTAVTYDATRGRATLQFGAALLDVDGLLRLEIGGAAVAAPVVFTEGSDTNSSFTTARVLGTLGAAGMTVTGAIAVRPTLPTPVGNLGFPSPPGALDTPGHRDVRVDSGSHGTPPFAVVNPVTGITTVRYDFRDIIGQDPQGNDLQNVITEAQKQRAREIFELFSLYSGVRFVEVGFDPLVPSLMVATGDLRAFNPNANSGSVAGLGGGRGALMNSLLNWGDSEYGGGWFQVAMHEIGHALGLGHTYDLPSIMGAELGGERVFPGDYDIEHLRQLYPNSGSDIDVYRFSLAEAGRFTAQTVNARPGMPVTTYLDAVLSLYRETTENGRTVRTLVARNDDYYGRDAFVGLDLSAGAYFLAVTSVGNTAFDPAISDSGAGGRSEGDYRLDLGFTPASAASNTIVDQAGTPLDGDRDGRAGGLFRFWFNAAPAAKTVYVDKANTASGPGNGTLANPFKTISAAVAAVDAANEATPNSRTILRIAGNPTTPYQIGLNTFNNPLPDGATFNVPRGVTAMIDSGAIFKMRQAVIDVGSSSPIVSRAGAAIQVLGVPATGSFAGFPVRFTSFHDDTIGGDSDGVGPAVQGGQWGGIVLRQDSDAPSRRAFVNTVSGAEMRYGGGQVSVDSQQEAFAPIQIESSRPTILFNTITNSAGAAIAATPNSFEDTGDRFGPEFRGNRLTQIRNDGPGNSPVLHQNSINGLFIKIDTEFGTPLDRLDVPARFKSTDIVHVIQENLVINGGVGGYVDRVSRLGNLVNGSPVVTGLATTTDLLVGMPVEIRDPDDPDVSALAGPATIVSIDALNRSVTLSVNAVVTRTAATVTFVEPNLGFARQSGRLTIDPGVVVKLQASRIELERGIAQLVAEGLPGKPVIFTSFGDNRYGAGGTFDSNGIVPDKFDDVGRPLGTLTTGDWGGIVLNAGSRASIDQAYVAFAGGETPIEGGFDNFNALEVHQGELRLANTRLEHNAAGTARTDRTGRGGNSAATVFVRGAQPIIVGNDFRSNLGAVIDINANSLSDVQRGDVGRSTGAIDRFTGYDDNFGPLVRENVLQYGTGGQAVAGMVVRGGEITVESVWDDVDAVHVVQDEIIVQNFHTATGIRLLSRPNASLVVKLSGANAGFTAAGENLDIDDRIGGTVQVVGQPGYPVVLTSLSDDTVGASLDPRGRTVTDTNTDGSATTPAAGDWRSLRFLPFSNDRNVTIYTERELAYTGGVEANETTASAEWLGTLGPNFAGANNTWESAQEKAGDENRRLGFEVHGNVAFDDPTDVDIYAFTGYAGSEVWIDVDKTSARLDAAVELLDAAGRLLARSADGVAEGGVIQGEVIPGVVAGTTATYQLAPAQLPSGGFSVVPRTLSGVIYEMVGALLPVPVPVQTFAFNANGTITFQNILGRDRLGEVNGVPVAAGGSASYATGGSVDLNTGLLTLTFSGGGMPASQVDVRYSYQTPALTAVAGDARTLGRDAWRGGDFFSQSPRDPGMRLILPGTQGAQNRYFLRVRSQPRYEVETTTADNGSVTAITALTYRTELADPTRVKSGATSGRYELRVRLRQRDEKPGSTVRYADIRYPTIGIDVQGLPANSPLIADTAENPTDNNDAFAGAQYIGNVLESNRNALSVAGNISGESDVDWYTFALNYEQLQSIAGVNDGPYNWSGIFDIDYADGFRGDLTISVFDSTGSLIYVGRDSDVSDDQPGLNQGTDFDDLSKGSIGKLDAFIGTVDLVAGGPTGGGGGDTGLPPTPPNPANQLRYYVAISSNERLPAQLNGTLRSAAANTVVRLEPIAASDRIVTDRIGGDVDTERLFDTTNLDAHVRPFTLSDVPLFVTTGTSLVTVDPMRGAAAWGGPVTTIVDTYGGGRNIGDLVMRTDGRMYVYAGPAPDTATAGRLESVDAGTGNRTVVGNDGIPDLRTVQQGTVDSNEQGVARALHTFTLSDADIQPETFVADLRVERPETLTIPGAVGTWRLTFDPAATPLSLADVGPIFNLRIVAVIENGLATPTVATVNALTGVVTVQWGAAQPENFRISIRNVSYVLRQTVNTNQVDAIAWGRTGAAGSGDFGNLYYSVRDNAVQETNGGPLVTRSRLYRADPADGGAVDPTTGQAVFVGGVRYGRVGYTYIRTAAGAANEIRTVTGMAYRNGTLYGVDTAGNFFSINTATAVATIIARFPGINFQGLTNGPQNLDGGALANLLFAIDNAGNLRALNLAGAPQAVFDVDLDGVIDNGLNGQPLTLVLPSGAGGGATGLAFSPLDINLWHTTGRRGGDPGGGGTNMYFGLENLTGSQFGGNDAWQQDLLSNPAIRNNYNLPGGAHGSLTTNPFSLDGYAYTDKPTLYFDYWLQTEGASGAMRDSARVLASVDGGLTWELLATNNSAVSAPDSSNAELPSFASVSQRVSNHLVIQNQHVQELFDTSNWRQARVDLGKFVGFADIRLRFDFHTAGQFDSTQQTIDIDGDGVNDLINDIVNDTTGLYGPAVDGVANQTGDFRSAARGQNNQFEGFYIDDVLIGFAERGEAVTGATAAATTFFDVGTPGPSDTVPAQVLNGPYQLEIRRGTELGAVTLPTVPETVVPETINTNDRLIPQRSTTAGYGSRLGDMNQPREQGQFIVENNIVSAAAQYGIRIDAAARNGGSNAPNPGSPRSLPTLNNQRLAAGAVVANNVVARSGLAGILFSGDPNTGNVPLAAVPFGRIVNNTFYGGEIETRTGETQVNSAVVTLATTVGLEAGMLVTGPGIPAGTSIVAVNSGTTLTLSNNATASALAVTLTFRRPATQAVGVTVTENAGPTLLNNLFVNLGQGITVDASSSGRTVVGTSAYFGSTGASGVAESNAITLTSNPFVNPSRNNFYLAAGSRAIDSSIDSLQDRNEFLQVNSPIGITASPIISPERDLYGQLRRDDPGVTNLPGIGNNVFKDRGAIDRVDFAQPWITISDPLDQGATDSNQAATDAVRLEKALARGITQFTLQLNDLGVGIDTATVLSDAFQVRRGGVLLVAGSDYLFNYLKSSNRVVFEAASVFPLGTYEISVVQSLVGGTPVNVITDLAGNPVLSNRTDGTTRFTIELVDVPTAPTGLVGLTGDARVSLSWVAASSVGTPLIRNEVQRATNASFTSGVQTINVAGDAVTLIDTPLVNGTSYWFRVRAVNAIGESNWSNIAGPIVPLPTPAPSLAVDTGVSATDGITSNGLVNVANLLPGATWEYSLDGGTTWSATQSASTSSFTLPANATYAAGAVRVRQFVGASQSAAGSIATAVTVDTIAPIAAPLTTVTDNVPLQTGPVADGGITNDPVLDLAGTTEAGTIVEIFNGLVKLGNAIVNGGAWTFATPVLTNGVTYALRTRVTDLAGNVGPFSATRSVTVDTAPPTAPAIISVIDDVAPATGLVPSGGVTNDTVLVLAGTTDAGTRVELFDGTTKLGDATVTGTTWTFTTAALANGVTYVFRARATDLAGNVSGDSAAHTVTIDSAAPAAPTITAVTDDVAPTTGPVASGGVTNDTVLFLTGTTEAGTAVAIYNGATKIGDAIVNGTAWTFSAGPLVNGTTYTFTARATDAASNVSPDSAPWSVTIDTVAPTITGFGVDVGPGVYGVGAVIRITATASEVVRAGSALVVTLNSGAVVTLLAAAQGNTLSGTYTIAAGQNAGQLAVVSMNAAAISDFAGNVGVGTLPGSNLPVGIVVDGIAPVILRYTSATPDGTYGIGSSIDITAVVSEPVQAGSTMTVVLSTNAQVTLVAATTGTTLSGSYVVQAGQATPDLDVVSVGSAAGVRDLGGNVVTNVAAGLNTLAATRAIIVRGAITIVPPAGFSTNPAVVPVRRTSVTSIPIVFNTPVSGFTLANISLRLGIRTLSLVGARLTGSGANYVLTLPPKLTSLKGVYTLRITGTGIVATVNGTPMTDSAFIYWRNA